MDIFERVVFCFWATVAIGGISILILLAPRPRTVVDHLRGVVRLMVVTGAAFNLADVLKGWLPPWHLTLLMTGLGAATALFARSQHLDALAAEQRYLRYLHLKS